MVSTPARYLLRIDDLCPTVARQQWRQLAEMIAEFRMRPILAVVPENRDPALEQSPADPEFWAGMRRLQAAGASIALHGYRHVCAARGRSLTGMHRASEFAGIDHETQQRWIRDGLLILNEHGLHARVWVAPRHGFDRNTLHALRAEGIQIISDGFARRSFMRYGMKWIPQQLWAPVPRKNGLWTICIHPNTMGGEEMNALRGFVHDRAAQFTSVECALAEFPLWRLGVRESTYAKSVLLRMRLREWRKRFWG